MKKLAVLMAGVAAVALTSSPVLAKSHSSSTSDMGAAPAAAPATDPRVDELSQRVDALEAELQQSEMRQASDHDKVDSWKPMSGWWDNTSISGRMYYDIADINNKANGVAPASNNNGVGFDIKRFYIGIDHTFNKVFSANITTDFNYDSGPAGATQLYIKKAYLQAKLDDALIIRIGSADLPWIPYAEDTYGLRYIENTLTDRVKFGTSADWGVHVLGKFYDGLIAYQFSAINGNGYKKPGFIGMSNHTKNIDVEGRVSLNYEGFQLAVGGYDGKLGASGNTVTYRDAQRFDALAAYTADGLRVGVEYFAVNNWNQVTSATTTSHGWGVSPFASYEFYPTWTVFGRYDYVKPFQDSTGARNNFKNDYFNVGLQWEPTKIVDFALVYKHDAGMNGSISDQNGTIGGTAFAMGNSGHDNEFGLWGQVRW